MTSPTAAPAVLADAYERAAIHTARLAENGSVEQVKIAVATRAAAEAAAVAAAQDGASFDQVRRLANAAYDAALDIADGI